MTEPTDEMVEAALIAWHDDPNWTIGTTSASRAVSRDMMRAALEAADRAAWSPVGQTPSTEVRLIGVGGER